MNRIALLILGFLVFTQFSFAAGKITPFPQYKRYDLKALEELEKICPLEDIDKSRPKPYVTNITGSLAIARSNGKEEFYGIGQSKPSSIKLEVGDQIKTYGGSSIINFSDGSSFSLYDHTTIVYGETESLIKIELLIGKLRIFSPSKFLKPLQARVRAKLESKIRVAAACVRGTDFIMEQTKDINTSKYYIYEGPLDVVTLTGETRQLNSGDIATINSDGAIVLENLDKEMWDQLISGPGFVEIPADIKPSNKKYAFGLVALLLFLIGVGALIYYRKKSY